MTKLWYVSRKNLKFELLPHFAIAAVILLAIPLIFSLNDLDRWMAASPLEKIAVLIGPVILIPLFLPEQDKTVADVMYTKQTPPVYVYLIRMIYSIIIVFLLSAILPAVMYGLNSEVTMVHYISMAGSAIFLGGMGIFIYALSSNVAASYMVPAIWYVLCLASGPKYKAFDIMMLSHGKIEYKWIQLIVGLILIVGAVVIRSARKK